MTSANHWQPRPKLSHWRSMSEEWSWPRAGFSEPHWNAAGDARASNQSRMSPRNTRPKRASPATENALIFSSSGLQWVQPVEPGIGSNDDAPQHGEAAIACVDGGGTLRAYRE